MSNLVVQTNVLALNSHRNLRTVGGKQATAAQRLSSGYRINSAADDAAGLAISEKMRAQIRGLDMASKNAQDGISLVQTAEGGMQEIDNMLQRIRELVVQASNDTNEGLTADNAGKNDRQKIQDEINQLVAGIDSMATQTEFNKKVLLNGTYRESNITQRNAAIQSAADALSQALQFSPVDTGTAEFTFNFNTGVGNWSSNFNGATGNVSFSASESFTVSLAQSTSVLVSGSYNATIPSYSTSGYWSIASDSSVPSNMSTTSDANYNLGGTTSVEIASTTALATSGTVSYNTVANGTTTNVMTGLMGSQSTLTNMLNYLSASNGANLGANTSLQTSMFTGDAKALDDLIKGVAKYTDALAAEASRLSGAYGTGVNDLVATINEAVNQASAKHADLLKVQAYVTDVNTKNQALKDAKAVEVDAGGEAIWLQTGANAGQGLKFNINSVTSKTLGLGNGEAHLTNGGDGSVLVDVVKASGNTGSVGTHNPGDVTSWIDTVEDALTYVTTERARLGAIQNRLEYTKSSLEISSENLSASESRIRDADMAKEMMKMTAANVLQQAGVSMLAQANQAPQSVLQLLR